jgi:hypothetical protein
MSEKLVTPFIAVELPLGQDLGPGQNPHGLICAANASRFEAGNFNEPLTQLSIGWKDRDGLDALLQRLSPSLVVPKRFSFRKAENAEAFLSETDDLRPIGSPFKQVKYSGTEVEARTYNRGLTVRIDHDEVDDLEAEVTLTIDRLRSRLVRNSLRRLFVLLDSADVAGGNKEFDVDTNPDGFIRAMAVAIADVCGLYPNVFAIGEGAWHKRLDAYEGATRDNGANHAGWTAAQLAAYLMADVVEIVKARYQSSATAKANISGATNRIYAYLAEQGASKDDPSSIKRFVSAGRNGVGFGVYRKDADKWTDLSMEHYENQIATGLGVGSIDAVTT